MTYFRFWVKRIVYNSGAKCSVFFFNCCMLSFHHMNWESYVALVLVKDLDFWQR